ncbi:MAG: DUF177 domain-containing protein [Syntrophobacterales bacterium]|jgi:uncharacterized protein|nr:DUF177 domain-containing protein [Syntrophobacterales bacterium]
MKIHIPEITDDGLELVFSHDGTWFRNLLPEGEEGLFALERIDVTCRAQQVRESIYIRGSLDTTVATGCSLCLEEALVPVNSRFEYTLTPRGGELCEDQELSREDMDMEHYDGETIDLDPFIMEQIFLHIPMRVVCSEKCAGLCPQCGINRNHGKCSCHENIADMRFSVLKDLKIN